MNRLQEKYVNEITPALVSKFEYSSVMQAPKVDKIVINMGVGEAVGELVAVGVGGLKDSIVTLSKHLPEK